MWYTITISLLAGTTIELFFRVIRYQSRESSQRPLPKYQEYKNYITVLEYIASGERRIGSYILFRTFPPTIVLVLSMALYRRYFSVTEPMYLIMLSTFISLLPRDIFCLFKNSVLLSEKIFHFSIIFIVTVATALLGLSYRFLDYSLIAPSFDGVIDNLWSSLLVAILVIFYLDATNQNRLNEDTADSIRQSNYVVLSFEKIYKKYGKYIEDYSKKNNTYMPLLYAILIFENMNRPEWIRKLEILLVKTLKRKMTVGIAQVYSQRSLTDVESIEIAAEYLKDSRDIFEDETGCRLKEQSKIIGTYNKDEIYVSSIMNILTVMKMYTPKAF